MEGALVPSLVAYDWAEKGSVPYTMFDAVEIVGLLEDHLAMVCTFIYGPTSLKLCLLNRFVLVML